MTKKIHISPNGPRPCRADPNNPRSTGCGYPNTPHFDDMASAEAAFAKTQGGALGAPLQKSGEKADPPESMNDPWKSPALVLGGVDLTKLDSTKAANIRGSVIHRGVFDAGDFSRIEARGSTLTKAYVNDTAFTDGDFRGASIKEARGVMSARYANFCGSDIYKLRAARSDLAYTSFRSALVYDSDLSEVDLSFVVATDVTMAGVSLRDANLGTGFFLAASFGKCDFTNADASSANFELAQFDQCKLSGVNWTGANLQGAVFDTDSFASANIPSEITGYTVK